MPVLFDRCRKRLMPIGRSLTLAGLLLTCIACLFLEFRVAFLHDRFTLLRTLPPTQHLPGGLECPDVELPYQPARPAVLPPERRSRLQRLISTPSVASPLTLKQLLDLAPSGAAGSVTVIVEFVDAARLCRQLRLLNEQTLPPHDVWVDAAGDAAKGHKAREVVASLERLGKALPPVSVFSTAAAGRSCSVAAAAAVTTLASSSSSAAAACFFNSTTGSRLRRFTFALQASSSFVLMLDSQLLPGPNLLDHLVRVAQLPMATGVLGVAGWRSMHRGAVTDVDADAVNDAEGAAAAAEPAEIGPFSAMASGTAVDAVLAVAGSETVSLPASSGGPFVHRLAAADLLRDAWFVRTEWVPLLFREPVGGQSLAHDEAEISSRFRRQGDLPSLVLPISRDGPVDDLGGGPPAPDAEAEAEWRRTIARSARRGETPPPWRPSATLLPLSAGEGTSTSAAVGSVLGFGPRGRRPASQERRPSRPAAVLLLRGAAEAAAARPLYAALAAATSRLEPRIAIVGCAREQSCSCSNIGVAIGVGSRALCDDVAAMVWLGGHDGDEGWSRTDAAAAADAAASLFVELDEFFRSISPLLVIVASGADAVATAAAAATAAHNVVLISPPAPEMALLEWLPQIEPHLLRRWHEPHITLAIITHRRSESLRRLLASLSAAHFLGDNVKLSFSIEAGADTPTVELAHGFSWEHGEKLITRRVQRGGLIAAVVESWTPEDNSSYGLLLEDDIEVSPFFFVYLRFALMGLVFADESGLAERLVGISLYTPRLVEVRMPRRRINLFEEIGAPELWGGARQHLFLQQLPCSWGSLFFPKAWGEFRQYMSRRLNEGAPAVIIPNSATNQWSTSWKKFMIEANYLRAQFFLYPNFKNQSSLSTNHLERGEHIGSKRNALKHLPIDFTVPLLYNFSVLRQLWVPAKSALRTLPVLDLFSEATSDDALMAQGNAAIAHQAELAAKASTEQPAAVEVKGRWSRWFSSQGGSVK